MRPRLRLSLRPSAILAGAVACLAATPSARAQESLADLAPFREGCQALADERFETAASRFLECWSLLPSEEVGGPEASFVAARLIESLVRNGDAAGALAWSASQERFLPGPAASYWLALAYESLGRYLEAAERYQAFLSAADPRGQPDPTTRVARAFCLSRSGEEEAAWELVSDLAETGPLAPASALRLALVAAAAGADGEALALADGIDPEAAPPELRLPRTRLRCQLLHRAERHADALAEVYQFLDSPLDEEEARRCFLLLEALLAGSAPAELGPRLEAWAADPAHPGREAAALFRIALLGEAPARGEALRAFARDTASPALAAEALLRAEEPSFPGDEGEDLGKLPPDLRERLGFTAIIVALHADDFESARLIAEKSGASDASSRARGLHNAAVSALRAEDHEAFVALEAELRTLDPRSPLATSLSYLGGLAFAKTGESAAFERLAQFVRDHPSHPANAAALLALAELHLNQAPARPREAREILGELRNRPLGLAQSERLEYDEVWAARIEGEGGELLRRARDFVSNWPNSDHLPEILMILGMEHEARQDAAEAAETYARVAAEFPDSPLAPMAAFLEAKATAFDDGAEEKWRRLAREGEPLADEATHELGLLLLSLDRFDEARAEFARLLEWLPPGVPLRFAVLADLAHASYLEALAGGSDPALLEEAARQFAALSQLADAPATWRFNAAVRRGKCLEAMGKASVALEIYRSIVDESRGNAGTPTPDAAARKWVFRAGFAAIGLLEEQRDWAAAIAVADTLSEKSGPRAIEAARLAQRLRLEHWVWD
jgi:TolA-binding protein